jgi:hypothetical protein
MKGQVAAKGSVKIRNDGKTPDQRLSITAEWASSSADPPNGQPVSIPIYEHLTTRPAERCNKNRKKELFRSV